MILTKQEIQELAVYNTQVMEGLVHTKEKKKRMKEFQKRYNQEITLEITKLNRRKK